MIDHEWSTVILNEPTKEKFLLWENKNIDLNSYKEFSSRENFRIFDLVRSVRPLPSDEGAKIPKGSRGTIVEVVEPKKVFMVEFPSHSNSVIFVDVDDIVSNEEKNASRYREINY
ncbi:DUF4926 domain-containing protein [Rhodovarius lipocyclicus]|uniref:DUF4926 domain-containing protein n=1 Tax=Rhodovarius lipocyclicus TaxID=268410 RepID=UPI00135B97E5|nr:DUF4926 domain-containing protein [Rhodovarius lipocyclicus]